MDDRTCLTCSLPLTKKPGQGRWPRYCSARCKRRAANARHEYLPVVAEVTKTCAQCGESFVTARDQRHRKHCSAKCRGRASYEAQKADGRAEASAKARRAKLSAQRKEARRKTVVECVCGATFCPMPGRISRVPKYCSSRCRNRAYSDARRATPEGRAKLNTYQQARVARAKGDASAKPLDAREIFDRDGWVCGLCQDPIPTGVPKRHPLSASLDHIVPLSLGGPHTHDNVQAAHLICNGRKGNRSAA